jgi:FkbM family methyltransferase
VFDIGANRGLWTRALLEAAGRRVARVWMFEPSVANQSVLNEIVEARGGQMTGSNAAIVRLVAAAVSDKHETAPLYSDAAGSGLASLHRRRLDHFGVVHREREEVRTLTLDSFVEEAGIATVDFVKLDIEGHELSALRGASGLLADSRIRALSFEFGGCNIDSRTFFQDFWYLLNGHGFLVYRLIPGGRLLPVRRYTEDLERFVTTNYFAVCQTGKLVAR